MDRLLLSDGSSLLLSDGTSVLLLSGVSVDEETWGGRGGEVLNRLRLRKRRLMTDDDELVAIFT
jgi:hypothetical protein